MSVRFPMGFVDSVVKLGRLRELKFWVRLSFESRLVVGCILGLLQWAAKFVARVFVFDWRCCVSVLCLRSLAAAFLLSLLPGGMTDGSVIPVVCKVTRALYSFSLSLESLKS